MAALLDHQFEVNEVVFGAQCPVEVETWTPSAPSIRNQDKDRPRGDGARPGRDRRGVAVWAFDAFTNGEDSDDALSAVEELGAVWPTPGLADTPGALIPLRYRIGGRTRRIYGRPREFDAPPPTSYQWGLVPITMNFVQHDPNVYDDVEDSVEVGLLPNIPGGGIRSPLVSPLRSTWTADRPNRGNEIVVEGTRETWLHVTFTGYAVNPYVDIGTLPRIQILHTVGPDPIDDKVVIDGRPWVASATLRGAAIPVAKTTRIAELRVPPGRHAVVFGSADGSSSGRATIRWRNARSTV